MFDLNNSMLSVPPACLVNSPRGTVESGDIIIGFLTVDPDSPILAVTFEYTLDGGSTFTQSAVAAASMAPYTTNPAVAPPGVALQFVWDSVADLPGTMVTVIYRVSLFDGASTSTCLTAFQVNNP